MSQNSFHTPEPWTVEPDPYGCGRYQIRERIAEERWVEEGYEVNDEEGDRREEIANLHNRGNSRLIERSLPMFKALKAIADTKVDENTDFAQLSALFVAMARTEIDQFPVGLIDQAKADGV